METAVEQTENIAEMAKTKKKPTKGKSYKPYALRTKTPKKPKPRKK